MYLLILKHALINILYHVDDDGCYPMASTPKKDFESSMKHAITPDSKCQIEPASKRLHTTIDTG